MAGEDSCCNKDSYISPQKSPATKASTNTSPEYAVAVCCAPLATPFAFREVVGRGSSRPEQAPGTGSRRVFPVLNQSKREVVLNSLGGRAGSEGISLAVLYFSCHTGLQCTHSVAAEPLARRLK